jgi:hypothetical protein
MSDRTLAYSEEPIEHRFLVIYEAVGMSGEFATYLMRSLLSEGRVRYETVEKTSEGIKPRLIEREGPTGLIVTTTAVKLHPENETRLLSLTVNDTPDQTRAILVALAEEEGEAPPNLATWHAPQSWLESAEHRVTIPYGGKLTDLIPPVAVRLRRDVEAVLNLIRAHALLHQRLRENSKGEPVTVTDIAKEMELDRSAVSRRVRNAKDRGYLRDLEENPRKPSRLVPADELPDDLQILPKPEEVRAGVAERAFGSARPDGAQEPHGNTQYSRNAYKACNRARVQEGVQYPPPLVGSEPEKSPNSCPQDEPLEEVRDLFARDVVEDS